MYIIDYQRCELKLTGIVLSIFKSLYKSTFIAFIKYINGSFSYISATHGLTIGQLLNSFDIFNFTKYTCKYLLTGSIVLLRLVPHYTIFCNLRLQHSTLPQYAKAAGTYCQVIEKFEDYQLAIVQRPTGLNKLISLNSYLILGRNSNIMNKYTIYGKAGIRRNAGDKPIVRGVARNPVDHPNGGRTKTNKPEKSL